MQNAFDFIVVGSGIAGLNSALTLAPHGKVLMVTKKKLNASSTYFAQGGIAAVIKKDDSIDSHVADTMNAGYHHNKKQAVDFLVQSGAQAVDKLIEYGVPFDKQDGDYVTSYEAAHSYPRILHATDFTGQEIQKSLVTQVLQNPSITIWENAYAMDLIVKKNICYGITILCHPEPRHSEFISESHGILKQVEDPSGVQDDKSVRHDKLSLINVFSRCVVLATGGAGQLYQFTTNPSVATGDGIAIAHRAGAVLTDLEFIQFHPTALRGKTSQLFLLSEALRGEGAHLLNAKGERFMQAIHPMSELAPRDVVARAIFHQQKMGTVYLDLRHKNKKFLLKRFPKISAELTKRGFDLATDLIPVTPAAHFICGGIETDIYGRTSITNLFAYGEVAATGVHGANRLASNSLLEGIVFSSQIEKCLDELPSKLVIARNAVMWRSHTRLLLLRQAPDRNDKKFKEIKKQIKKIMWEYVGIERTPAGLLKAQKQLEQFDTTMQKTKKINKNVLEIKNMLEASLTITNSAIEREQSLGTHYVLTNI